MKKKLAIMISTLLALLMVTGVALAATITEEYTMSSNSYSDSILGDKTQLFVDINSSIARARFLNKSSSDYYLYTQVKEYKYNYGWTGKQSYDSGTVSPGSMLTVSITRDTSIQGYYYYYGKCGNDAQSPAVYDTLIYKTHQVN